MKIRLSAVDSTNAEAMRRAAAGVRGPLWIAADTQTAGRGRSGRSWSSDVGNLHASLLVTLAVPAARAYQLALVAGVAGFDALAAAAGPEALPGLRLKWPNDILINGEKAGGILIESSILAKGSGGEAPELAAVIGMGINVVSAPAALDRPVTCLAAHGVRPDSDLLLARLSEAMEAWIDIWLRDGGFAVIREAWLNRAHPLGERMTINTGSERVSGLFLGLDPDGALRLETDGGARCFSFGDVSLEPLGPGRQHDG